MRRARVRSVYTPLFVWPLLAFSLRRVAIIGLKGHWNNN